MHCSGLSCVVVAIEYVDTVGEVVLLQISNVAQNPKQDVYLVCFSTINYLLIL